MISFIRLHKKNKKQKKTVNPAKTHDAFCPVTQASSSTESGLDRIGSDWIGLDRTGSDWIGLDHGPDRESDHINSPFGLYISRGSIFQARCKCKGGRNGVCKHIAAALYSLEDLLNTRDKGSVTSGPLSGLKNL